MAFKMKGPSLYRNSPMKKDKTRFTDKITAALNAPIEGESYKDMKAVYRRARRQGLNPADLDRDQLQLLKEKKKVPTGGRSGVIR
tara:strand:+ start:425 stop:679 length:255 start_codon:yes stop_codon:yes gene_type:complete